MSLVGRGSPSFLSWGSEAVVLQIEENQSRVRAEAGGGEVVLHAGHRAYGVWVRAASGMGETGTGVSGLES